MAEAVRVVGLAELTRAFGRADKTVRDDLNDALAEAAAPVRTDARSLAGTQISHMRPGAPWTAMRIGVSRTVAYVAPVERGIKGRGGQQRRRPRFGDLLMGLAMEPALERNVDEVQRRMDGLLDEVANVWERG
jgi:hypothetical protein